MKLARRNMNVLIDPSFHSGAISWRHWRRRPGRSNIRTPKLQHNIIQYIANACRHEL